MKIGKHEIKHPIIQGGLGVGISWDQLAGNVSLEGGLGVISAVGTGYYKNKSDYEIEIVNVFCARSQKIGSYNLMKAQNPVYVISANRKGE